MTDTEQFKIGTAVSGSDGPIGKLTRVVVDPIARVVTHLMVEPAHGAEISLSCSAWWTPPPRMRSN